MPSASCSMRSARVVSVNTRVADRDVELAPDLGMQRRRRRRAAAAPRRRTSARCARSAATRTRAPPDNPASGAKCFSPSASSAASGSAGSALAYVSVNSPIAPWITVPRSRAPGGVSTASSGRSSQNVLGVDRVGIAQPVLDLGDAEPRRPRLERRRRARALRSALTRLGAVEIARPGEIFLAARERGLPVRLAGDRREPLHEARRDRRRAAELGGAGEDHLGRAEQLREVVRRQPDAPLGQIEPEVEPHRTATATDRCASPAARRLRPARRARRGRRLQAALRAGRECARARPAVRRGGRRGRRSRSRTGRRSRRRERADRPRCSAMLVERVGERRAVLAGECGFDAGVVARQRAQRLGDAAPRCARSDCAAPDRFQRRQRSAERCDQCLRGIELGVCRACCADRSGAASSCVAARNVASACARPAAAGLRPRPAQHRQLQRRDGARMRACRRAEPEARDA